MEDGSALSPLVASQSQSNPIHHLRVLATLVDCPIYTRPSGQQLNSILARRTSLAAGQDEQKMNSIMFECLRRKPIELLAEKVQLPIELMQMNSYTGQISLQSNFSLSHTGAADESQPNSLGAMMGDDTSILSSLFRPPFGLALDPMIMPPGEDLASLMLNSSLQFGRFDLLLGLSDGSPISVAEISQQHPEQVQKQMHRSLRPSHILADRLSSLDEQAGLSTEQSVELINAFVRSFYRYHNQEITNSIVSHYLRRATSASMYDHPRLQNLQQLDSLLEAFQDSLVNVPLLRVALIHASHQFSPLRRIVSGRLIKAIRVEELTEDNSTLPETKLIAKTLSQLVQSFADGVPTIYTSSEETPNDLDKASDEASEQPRATYLYQFNAEGIFQNIQSSIEQLTRRHSDDSVWFRVRLVLEETLETMKSDEFPLRLGFSCAFARFDQDELDDAGRSRSFAIALKFNDWLCSTMSTIIGDFTSHGRMMLASKTQKEVMWQPEIDERRSAFGSRCMDPDLNPRTRTSCDSELTKLAFDVLAHTFTEDTLSIQPDQLENHNWVVFNQLTRRVASLPKPKTIWSMSSITDNPSELDQKSSFAARSTFWLNFLPALNCSRTQPINTGPLDSGLSSNLDANSPLLNLNLIFHCQNGARTSYDVIGSYIKSIQRTVMLIRANHHSLRMANQSQSNDENLTVSAELQNISSRQDSRSPRIVSNDSSNPLLLAISCTLVVSSVFIVMVLIRHRWISSRSKVRPKQTTEDPTVESHSAVDQQSALELVLTNEAQDIDILSNCLILEHPFHDPKATNYGLDNRQILMPIWEGDAENFPLPPGPRHRNEHRQTVAQFCPIHSGLSDIT